MEGWPLHLGSKGQRTKTAQWLMQGHNVHQIHTYIGDVDGIAGAKTVKGFRETRFWLGFPQEYILGEYGPVVQEYLLGERKLPLTYRARRLQRQIAARKTRYYPLARRGLLIGFPGQGTHSWWAPPNNWQSDNAVDILIAQGTPVLAYRDGVIGSRIGALSNSGARFHGLRLTLEAPDGNAYYYAHLSRLVVTAGQHVRAGQTLGYSGEANGVNHLHWAVKNGNPVTLVKGV